MARRFGAALPTSVAVPPALACEKATRWSVENALFMAMLAHADGRPLLTIFSFVLCLSTRLRLAWSLRCRGPVMCQGDGYPEDVNLQRLHGPRGEVDGRARD